MTMRTMTASFAVALLLCSATAAVAGPHHGQYSGNCASNCPAYGQLTPEKQAEVDQLIQQHIDAMAPLREQLQAKRLELSALSGNSKAEPEYISKLSAEIAHLTSQIRKDGEQFRIDLREKTGLSSFGNCGWGRGDCGSMRGSHRGGCDNGQRAPRGCDVNQGCARW